MSAQHQSAEVKARANQTKNQVLSHPYVQQGAAVANQYAVRLDKHVSTTRSIRRTSLLYLIRDFRFPAFPTALSIPHPEQGRGKDPNPQGLRCPLHRRSFHLFDLFQPLRLGLALVQLDRMGYPRLLEHSGFGVIYQGR